MSSEQEVIRKIFSLDLKQIKVKIIKHSKNKNLRRVIDKIEYNYKIFLLLNYFYPNRKNVPNELVDDFWHYHILDTKKYREDCIDIFGRFLDHNPYFGLSSKEEQLELQEEFQITNDLLQNIIVKANAAFCNGGFEEKTANAAFCNGGFEEKTANAAFCNGGFEEKTANAAFCNGGFEEKTANAAFCNGGFEENQ